MVPEINALELAQRIAGPNPPLMIDVREPDEHHYCRIEGAQIKPLGDIATWAAGLDPQAEIVFQCHSGFRSAPANAYLQNLGFKHVYNVRGSIDAFSAPVDPSMPRY